MGGTEPEVSLTEEQRVRLLRRLTPEEFLRRWPGSALYGGQRGTLEEVFQRCALEDEARKEEAADKQRKKAP